MRSSFLSVAPRRRAGRRPGLLFTCLFWLWHAASGQVAVATRDDLPACARFGAVELERTLREAGLSSQPVPGGAGRATIQVESLEQPPLTPERGRYEGLVPAEPESFAIEQLTDGGILILGRDAVGTMYGALEAAERIARSRSLAALTRTAQRPFLAIRAVNQFLHEDALQDPQSWFYREDFWEGFFALLARSRHNLLDLHAGYNLVGTNFPNVFPYFVHLAEFPRQSAGPAQVERNAAMLNRIIALGKRHGVNVALMNYTVQGRKGEEKSPLFTGLDGPSLAEYTRLACRKLLTSCPDLWMYGFRIGESGQPEDFYQKTYLAALRESGYRGKLFTRSWLATRKNIEAITADFKGDFYIEVKYNGEQLGLPYQAITSPTRFDPSYSYEGYTDYPRRYRLLYQIRANGTHRLFHWADPAFMARVAKSCRLGEAAGFSLEPMTAYYPMTDQYHPAEGHHFFQWTWQRDWFWYLGWGRLAYDPDLDPRVFADLFEARFGRQAGAPLYRLLAAASQVVPFVASYICLGPDHRQWAAEFEMGNPDFTNVSGLRSTGDLESYLSISSLDPTVMSSIVDDVAATLEGRLDGRLGPLAAAAHLTTIASRIETALGELAPAEKNAAEAECLRLDAEALLHLARYHAAKYTAGLRLEEYRRSGYPRCLTSARQHLYWAREHWRRLAAVADGHYAPLLDTLRMRTQGFRWGRELAHVDADLGRIAQLEQALDPEGDNAAPRPLAHLPVLARRPRWYSPEEALWPVDWRASGYERVRTGDHWALRSRGGTIGFDVEDLFLYDADADVVLDLEYHADAGAPCDRTLRIRFDGRQRPVGELVEAQEIALDGAAGWRWAHVRLEHARFAGSGPGLSDVVVSSSDGGEFVLGRIALRIERWPSAHLEVAAPVARKESANHVRIHWRRPGDGPWTTTTLERDAGEAEMETQARGREYCRFAVPPDATALEYFFTTEKKGPPLRLPAGDGEFYRWRAVAEEDPPALLPEPFDSARRREGPIEIRVRASDASGVERVRLYHKPIPSNAAWETAEMERISEGVYRAVVPLTPHGLLYRFGAVDRLGNAALYPDFLKETPYLVVASWEELPTGGKKP